MLSQSLLDTVREVRRDKNIVLHLYLHLLHENTMDFQNIRWTVDQKNALICYMRDHSEFAANRRTGCNGRQSRRQQWERVAAYVNLCGPHKTDTQCENQWKSLKSRAKEYNAEKKRILKLETGNRTEKKINVTVDQQLEDVLAVVGDSHNNGLPMVQEVGVARLKKKSTKRVVQHMVVYEVPSAKQQSKFKVEISTSPKVPEMTQEIKAIPMRTKIGTRSAMQKSEVHTSAYCAPSTSTSGEEAQRPPTENFIKTEQETLNYSEQYSQYASAWRRKKATTQSKTDAAIEVMKENNQAMFNVQQSIKDFHSLMEAHFKKKEKYYEETMKYYKRKL